MAQTSSKDACVAALRAAGHPLTASEIADMVVAANVVPGLKGKTPKATVAAVIFAQTKKGTTFKHSGGSRPQKFDLRADAPDSEPQLVAALKKQVVKAAKPAAAAKPVAKAAAKPDPKPAKKARQRRRSSPRSAVAA